MSSKILRHRLGASSGAQGHCEGRGSSGREIQEAQFATHFECGFKFPLEIITILIIEAIAMSKMRTIMTWRLRTLNSGVNLSMFMF